MSILRSGVIKTQNSKLKFKILSFYCTPFHAFWQWTVHKFMCNSHHSENQLQHLSRSLNSSFTYEYGPMNQQAFATMSILVNAIL